MTTYQIKSDVYDVDTDSQFRPRQGRYDSLQTAEREINHICANSGDDRSGSDYQIYDDEGNRHIYMGPAIGWANPAAVKITEADLVCKPRDFVGIHSGGLIYIGIKGRAEFNMIEAEAGETVFDDGQHVLWKTVENDTCTVIFQHWLLTLTSKASMAKFYLNRDAKKAARAAA
jgi:hypothetical protein